MDNLSGADSDHRTLTEMGARDLEMTRLAAEAMGLEVTSALLRVVCVDPQIAKEFRNAYSYFTYDPLHDDAQAMALVKRLGLSVRLTDRGWRAFKALREFAEHADLNRAIVEAVAKMQQQRTPSIG